MRRSKTVSIPVRDHAVPRLLSPEEAGTLLGVAPQTLAHWRVRGGGPVYVTLSRRCIRYPEDALLTWIEARLRGATIQTAHEE